ncbi:hypothetical protein [Nonomuraea jiangxiensis]|nr:hypothetical protein [Nonomuraea jiangxiensis]
MQNIRQWSPDRPADHDWDCPHWTVQCPGAPLHDDGPAYGLGADGRPLWTERDRDAERVRAFLRRARRAEIAGPRGGFIVTGGHGGVFLVTCTDPQPVVAGEVSACMRSLARTGLSVEPHPDDERTLRVRLAPIARAS